MPALKNPKHETFAQMVATGSSGAEAHRKACGSSGKSSDTGASKLRKNGKVAARIYEIRQRYAQHVEQKTEKEIKKRFLTLDDKREFLARVVQTPLGEIDETSDLCQSAEFAASMGKKIKVPDKLRAIELDARLAGEFVPQVEVVASDALTALLMSLRNGVIVP